ncbi:MAG: FAD-dependent oxidoreductase [Bdellovibrionales bacterium]|nr:FAD-dependent oxidoreductase [Bdellovibrionales bacterium]
MTNHSQMFSHKSYNQDLIEKVAQGEYQNPNPASMYNMVVVGAGPAGLVCAMACAGLGAKVALIEKKYLGGDCLNFGCVPSKAILSQAHRVQELSYFFRDQIIEGQCRVNFSHVMKQMRKIRAKISVHDAKQKILDAGIDLFFGEAHFESKKSLRVGKDVLNFKKALIATGSQAKTLQLDGLSREDYHTSDTIFDVDQLPESITLIGSGAISCELAQAFASLGSKVTIVTRSQRLLPKEDEEISHCLEKKFNQLGIDMHFSSRLYRYYKKNNRKYLVYEKDQKTYDCSAQELLVCIGRRPNINDLDLEKAGVLYTKQGISVNEFLQTQNKNIFACGDVLGRSMHTHHADAQARVVVENALFSVPIVKPKKKYNPKYFPHCTYTSPEVAHMGLLNHSAKRKDLDCIRINCQEVDRYILDQTEEGFLKVWVDSKSHIYGVSMIGDHAGEIVSTLALAMDQKIPLSRISSLTFSYPTKSEIIKKAADALQRKKLTPKIQKVLRKYFLWRR